MASNIYPAGSTDAESRLDQLLAACVQRGASDLHIAPGLAPYLRIQGVVEPHPDLGEFDNAGISAITDLLTRSVNTEPLVERGALDGALSAKDGSRFRFNIYRRQDGFSIALRKLENHFRTLEELGLPENLYDLCQLSSGLVLVAGPTGSGKSTTLATLIDRINQTRQSHIVTIEDPVEYIHKPACSLVNQRQVGTDASSFNDALVASLRQDPDVILVGEIRDLNTIRTAITASETGHLVFATVHAGDCVGVIERLVSVFPADEQHGIRRQLSLVLRKIIAQVLLVCDGSNPEGIVGRRNGDDDSATHFRHRVVCSEILTVTTAAANLIATGKSSQIYSAIESGTAQGMQTFEQDLARLWIEGRISEATAVARARNPQLVRERAQRLRQASLRDV